MLSPQLFLCFTIYFTVVSAQNGGSCVGRCGQGYFRGDPCHCDYTCMSYMECCLDYKTVCTTEGSCQGRCHEGFIRGQTCDCDPSCVGYGKCCPDYEKFCAKPVQKQSSPPPSPERPDPDPTDNSLKPTKKPEEREPENAPEESEENESSSSFSSSSSSSSVKGSTKTKKLSRKNQKKKPQDGDDIPDPDNPEKNKKPKDKDDEPKEPNSPNIREGDNDPGRPPKEPNERNPKDKDDKPKEPRSPTSKERGDDAKGPDTNPKEPSLDDKDKKNKKPKVKDGDEPEDPEPLPKDPNQKSPDDKDGKPRKPETSKPNDRGDGPGNPGNKPRDPNQKSSDDKDGKPRKPESPKPRDGEEGPGDPGNTPRDPNQKSPDDKDGKPRKPESPRPKDGEEGPGDPGNTPRERLPKSPKDDDDDKPTKTKTSKVIENTEDEEEETEHSEDSPRKPSPSDKGKNTPTANKPIKKKKGNPEDDEEDEPSKPGKGKNPKRKPSPKDIVKTKKKINSEEERQETVEREFSSSSQSSSSHSRSKSVRRKTGKNKKNLKEKNKKKFPDEEPEDPLMPPRRKKYPPSTPAYPTPDEGSGEDGSGMDFLQTTIVSTTVGLNTSTQMLTTVGTKKPEETLKPSINPQTESSSRSSYKTTTNIPIPVSTEKQATDISTTTLPYTQSSTEVEKTKGLDTTTGTTPQQTNTLNTPQDQSTADSNVKHTTPGLEKTAVPHKSTPMVPTKHTPESGLTTTSLGKDSKTSPKTQTMDHSTKKMNEYSTTPAPKSTLNPNESQPQTKDTVALTAVSVTTNPTTRHADDFTSPKDSTENSAFQSTTSTAPVKQTTKQPDMDQTTKPSGQRPIPDEGSRYEAPTKQVPNTKTTSIPKHTTSVPKDKNLFTTMPVNEDGPEISIATAPYTIHPHHICNLLKDEAISLRIPESDLKRITEICAEMQKQYPNVNIPSLPTRQPNIDDIPPRYPLTDGTPSIWYQQPGSNIIQIIEEINRRMNISPVTNFTGIPSQNPHKSTAWLLLINKIKLANDPQKNLCIGPPADGVTTLQNGSLVVFRGHYFWTLNQAGATAMPRKISEVWGIPSPIDTVFTRCNCGGKTFFFKGPRYWRFTNDVMDKGYPKEIIKGFGGLGGKVNAVLSVAGVKTRPESVYFFKPGGKVQKYTFRQEQSKRCTKKKQPTVNYPIYSQKVQTVKFRFPRDIVQHRIQIRRTFTNIPQPLGILHEERTVRSTWRGIPSNIVSAVSLPNPQKQDGFDYFVFTKDKYYNINMSSKVAVKPPADAEQKTTKEWYKCKE